MQKTKERISLQLNLHQLGVTFPKVKGIRRNLLQNVIDVESSDTLSAIVV